MLLILIYFFSKDSFIISLINIPIYLLISFLDSIYELDYLITLFLYEYMNMNLSVEFE